MLFILQADDTGAVDGDGLNIFGALEQAFRLELFTAEPNHHDFTAEIGV